MIGYIICFDDFSELHILNNKNSTIHVEAGDCPVFYLNMIAIGNIIKKFDLVKDDNEEQVYKSNVSYQKLRKLLD